MKSVFANQSPVQTPPDRPDQLIDGFLSEKLQATLDELRRQAWQTDGTDMPDSTYDTLKRLRQLRSALATLMSKDEVVDARTSTYLIGAAFLREAFAALTKTADEDLVYATGPEDGKRLFALTRLVTFDLAQRSLAHAAPEHSSQLAALSQLDRNKERLLATLHSHPGRGAGSTAPSSVDLSTQRGLEKNGYPSIGAIFARDGYVRFYSVNRLFRVAVSGAGVRQVDDKLFQVEDVQPKSLLRILSVKPLVHSVTAHAKTLLAGRFQ